MLEVQVHEILRQRQRQQPLADWPHQLTMSRLVAQALRQQRPALIQTGVPAQIPLYVDSYLIPALLWPGTVAIVADNPTQQRLLQDDAPRLQKQLGTDKPIGYHPTDRGLLFLTPDRWLAAGSQLTMPVIVDGADQLPQWVQSWLQVEVTPLDWEALLRSDPTNSESIRDRQVRLTKSIFQRPINPYNCYLLTATEKQLLPKSLAMAMGIGQTTDDRVVWGKVDRQQGTLTLTSSRLDLSAALVDRWAYQHPILIGQVLDVERNASNFRQALGLGEMTCVKFAVNAAVLPQLYIPNWIPMPNTPKFQEIFAQSTMQLLAQRIGRVGLIVIVIGDTPLKAQIAAQVAAEYGSRVQVEKLQITATSILITGWAFWNEFQNRLPSPQLMIIATLPIPSLEDPLVAVQVSGYKHQRQDWFRNYLLPTGLQVLQRSLFAIRQSAGLVAIFDNRINHRSYGKQVLAALSPMVRVETPRR